MSFKELQNIQLNYHSLADDVVTDFYIPCLEKSMVYKRAVGFFSSNILLQLSKGLGAFADNGGKMKLLVSTRLEQKDYEAIEAGYDAKKLLLEKTVNNFDFDVKFTQKEDRFKMLSYMISTGLLDIKVVALEKNYDNSMYHDKLGIMYDNNGNIISFSGSANETYNAFNNNYESIDVYCSWASDESEQRCYLKETNFNRIWNGIEKGLITIPFPEVIKEKILSYKWEDNQRFTEIDEKFKEIAMLKKIQPKMPEIPDTLGLRDYQDKAIANWKLNNYRGIFDMATGTGKTYTGAGAICRLFNDKKRLFTIICAPYVHLVDQWCDELKQFSIDPIKCYGNLNYEKDLKRAVTKFKQKRTDFVCIVICNASFKKDSVQDLIMTNLKDTLLIVDEAHNFGADGLSEKMNVDYPYRLALSATLDRYGDEEGTRKLYEFFGEKCISYSLERAIQEDKLTPYKYFPVPISLTSDEYDEYVSLSCQIAKQHSKDGELSEYAKMLLIKRARLIAGASNKLIKLEELLKPYVGKKNMLIYCGAVKYGEQGYEKATEEKKQIELVLNILNNKLHIYSSKFTSEEDPDVRKNIIKSFKDENLDALVAIKCLDEGMNIPAIKTAFILASSTNPKEYIQRRGRVLRKSDNKDFAEIYDFIALPSDIEDFKKRPIANLAMEKNLARKELERLKDFANLSMNPSYSNDIISKITEKYAMDIIMEDEDKYE